MARSSKKSSTVNVAVKSILQAALDALAADIEKKKISTNHINVPSRIRKAGNKAKADGKDTQRAVEVYLAACTAYVYGKNDGRLNRMEELRYSIECSGMSDKELEKIQAEAFASSEDDDSSEE